MHDPERIHLAWLLEHGSRMSAGIAVAVGVLALLGWGFDLTIFKSGIPGLTPMSGNTALGFVLAGVSLWSANPGVPRPFHWSVSQICAVAVLLLGLLTLAEYLSGKDFGIDQLLVRDVMNPPGEFPGRMSFNSAVGFTALGASLALLIQNKGGFVGVIQTLAIVPILLAGITLFEYAFGLEQFLRVRLAYKPMALNTATVFVLLGLGIVNAHPAFPFRRIMASDNAAGNITRRLLPAAIGFPFVIGWLIVHGHQVGYFSQAVGVALFAVANIGGLSAVILWNASLLEAIDTRRKQGEAKLRSTALYARSLIEASLDPLVTISPEGKITDVNDATIKVTGVPHEQLIGTDFHNYFTEPEQARAGYQQVFARGFVTDYPLAIRHQDGHLTDVLYNASVYRDAQGNVLGVFAAARDITERKQAEEEIHRLNAELEQRVIERTAQFEAAVKELKDKEAQLVQAQKMEAVGQLTGGIAHDFNNLLTVILGNLGLLADGILSDASMDSRELLFDAISAAQDGAELTHRLLAFSGKQPLQIKLVDINGHLSSIRPLLQRTLREDIELRIHTDSDAPPVLVDPAQLESALVNLVINARDAMPGGGTLTIGTARQGVRPNELAGLTPGNYAVLTVSDSGVGMSPAVAARAFEPFFTTKERGKGSGLGLSMVYGFAKRSGGTLLLSSALGKGTTVSVLLPEAGSDIEAESRDEMVHDVPGGSETILLVEDEPQVRRLAKHILVDLGYELLEAKNAAEAMKAFEGGAAVDLLFSDIVMPGPMNGRELARWVLQRRSGSKVLLTTGFSDEETGTPLADKGDFHVLRKPYVKKELAAAVRAVLDAEAVQSPPQ